MNENITDENITRGFIGENGIYTYMIDITPSKVTSRIIEPYPKDVTLYTLTGPGTFKPDKVIKEIDSVFLFVTTYSGSDYVLNLISGTVEIGNIDAGIDGNKRIYFKTEKIEDINVLKLFIPI